MKSPNTQVRAKFTQLILTLSRLVQELQNELNVILEHKADFNEFATNLDTISSTVSEISNHLTALSGIQAFMLLEGEYILFCDLLICGSEMAAYLSQSKSIRKSMYRHSSHWQKLVRHFKPMLDGILVR